MTSQTTTSTTISGIPSVGTICTFRNRMQVAEKHRTLKNRLQTDIDSIAISNNS